MAKGVPGSIAWKLVEVQGVNMSGNGEAPMVTVTGAVDTP